MLDHHGDNPVPSVLWPAVGVLHVHVGRNVLQKRPFPCCQYRRAKDLAPSSRVTRSRGATAAASASAAAAAARAAAAGGSDDEAYIEAMRSLQVPCCPSTCSGWGCEPFPVQCLFLVGRSWVGA